jgi:hypothetical protein
VEGGAAEDRFGNGAYCQRVSVVMGDVIDIGESAWRFAATESMARLRASWLGLCPCPCPQITGGKVMSSKTKRCANRAAQALRLAAAALRTSQPALGTGHLRQADVLAHGQAQGGDRRRTLTGVPDLHHAYRVSPPT